MVDNTRLNINTTDGDDISTNEITGGVADGAKVQRVKVGFGSDGEYGDVTPENALPVEQAPTTDQPIDLLFTKATGAPTTLSAVTAIDDRTLTLASTIGFIAGGFLVVVSSSTGRFYVATQLGAPAGSVITVDTPLDTAFAIGDIVVPLTKNMAVDGSVTPQVFQIGSASSVTELDIHRFLGGFLDGSVMDDGLFGGIAALTNGCVLRVVNGTTQNFWNVKRNFDFRLLGFDLDYAAKAPAGQYGASFRISYGGEPKHGTVIRVAAGDVLEFIIQDDLTGLDDFNLMAQGHIVE